MKLLMTNHYKTCSLIVLAVLFLFLYYAIKPNSVIGKHRFYSEMIAAAKKMRQLQQAIRQETIKRGIEIDKTIDIQDSGLIGLEWSGITTTLGNIESKRTTVNPDFAALLVKLFKEAGLQQGDYVAANCSGSFPALNLAFIAAADILQLKTVMVTSVGSSTYGGNREDFTYLDMEYYLYSKNLIQNKTIAYSLGGVKDIGQEFEADSIGRIKERLDGYGLTFFYESDFEKNLVERYTFYTNILDNASSHNTIKAFVNIGGNLLSLGAYNDSIDTEKVRLTDSSVIKTGLIGLFLQTGMPVFYLLNIKSIARYYRLPFDPVTLPEIGTAPIYYHTMQYIRNYILLGIFFATLILHRVLFKRFRRLADS